MLNTGGDQRTDAMRSDEARRKNIRMLANMAERQPPAASSFSYCIQCTHPDTGKVGDWLYEGENHRQPGTSLSPVFDDLGDLFTWMKQNGYRAESGHTLRAVREK